MGRLTVNSVARDPRSGAGTQGLARVGIRVKPRRAAGGDVHPQALAAVEDHAGRTQVNVEFANLAGLEQLLLAEGVSKPCSEAALAEVERAPIRIHIAKPNEEVRVGRIAGRP